MSGTIPDSPAEETLPLKPTKDSATDDALFDGLIEAVGGHGYFQKRLNFVFNFVFVTIMTLSELNIILIMSVPEHHCHVPGRNAEKYTQKEWWQLNLPKSIDNATGAEVISSCKMFGGENQTEITDCRYGYEYDSTYYVSTAPSENNWVCADDLNVANAFVAVRVGQVFGCFVFGQLGDRIGRKPVYYISLVFLIIGRAVTTLTSHSYPAFLFFAFLGSLATVSVFQTPLVIGLEVTSEKKRATIAFIQCLSWVVANCSLPMIQWGLGSWKVFMLATSLPSILSIFFYRVMPESPRWLASRGKSEEAAKVLKYIAKVNKTQTPKDMYVVLEKIASTKEQTYGIASLFSSIRLARNTLIIMTCWSVSSLCYYSIFLNISNMAGNPFMNFFWQALVELPGYIAGRYLANKIGRRWVHTSCYGLVVLTSVAVILTLNITPWLTTTLVTLMKLMVTIAFYMVWLQAMEIYPTCVRQTGTSIGGLVANIFGVLGPFIVYLGTTIDRRLPYVVLCGLGLLGLVCSSFLPETLNKKLPETLEDARNFGKEEVFWSINKTKKSK